MLRVAICDDETAITSQIESLIYDICQKENIPVEIDVCFSGDSLEKVIASGESYDLIYLDIQMANGDGITTARHIRQTDENVIIIFVSGYDKYLIELFPLDVFSFIMKPIESDSFMQTFLEAVQRVCNKNFYFTFCYKSQEYKIPCRDILYFESKGRQVIIHRKDGEDIFNGKLSEVERKLEKGKNPFLRIHQSFLVNYHSIKARSKEKITLVSGVTLPVSEERQKEFSKEYAVLLRTAISGDGEETI